MLLVSGMSVCIVAVAMATVFESSEISDRGRVAPTPLTSGSVT